MLHNSPANFPIRRRHQSVDDPRRGASRYVQQFDHAAQYAVVISRFVLNRFGGLRFVARFAHKTFTFADFYRISIRLASQTIGRNSQTCRDSLSQQTVVHPCGVDFRRVHPPASRASGCSAAISRHEIIRVTALLSAPPPASAGIRLHAFRSDRSCSPRREAKRAIPLLQNRNAKI